MDLSFNFDVGVARDKIRSGPVAKIGITKYGSTGLYSGISFTKTGMSLKLCEQMADIANHSLSRSTWSTYKTVKGHLDKCQMDLKVRFSFPMTSSQVISFVSWLLKRGLKANTVNTYVSGLRTIHLTKRVDELAHIDTIEKRLSNKPARVPVTLNVLKLINAAINRWEETDQMRLLVWSVCLICFFGGFRIHELLCRNTTQFDPAFTLLGKDIKVTTLRVGSETILALQILIKSPKEDRVGKECIIDVYETKGTLCPVKYFKNGKKKHFYQLGSLPF